MMINKWWMYEWYDVIWIRWYDDEWLDDDMK